MFAKKLICDTDYMYQIALLEINVYAVFKTSNLPIEEPVYICVLYQLLSIIILTPDVKCHKLHPHLLYDLYGWFSASSDRGTFSNDFFSYQIVKPVSAFNKVVCIGSLTAR